MAQDWKTKLNEAKEMLDSGLISQEEYNLVKQQALRSMTDSNAESTPHKATDVPSAIGAYTILGVIGEGGMGVVYRGKHRNEEKARRQGGEVAIKVMHAHYVKNAELAERFEQEATLGMKVTHEGIVSVYDLISDGGRIALVMELVQGRPLSEVIGFETGPIPWEKAKGLFYLILQAVGSAHQQGVVHRDIKPENIMVTDEQRIKILDFGIAKQMDSSKTKTGTGMGTVSYMAPEQFLDAKKVDRRADIYALGMTLYEMVAGQLPWERSETEFVIMQRKANGSLPPPTDFYPHIPKFVIDSIAKATAVSIADRFTDCEQFILALEGKITVQPPVQTKLLSVPEKQHISVSTVKPSRSWLFPVMGVLLILGIGVFLTISPDKESSSKRKKSTRKATVAKPTSSTSAEVAVVPPQPPSTPSDEELVLNTVSLVYQGWEQLDHDVYMSAWSRDAVWKSNKREINYDQFRKKREKDYQKFRSVYVDWNCDKPKIQSDTARVFCTYSMFFTYHNDKTLSEENVNEFYRLKKESTGWKIIENRDYL